MLDIVEWFKFRLLKADKIKFGKMVVGYYEIDIENIIDEFDDKFRCSKCYYWEKDTKWCNHLQRKTKPEFACKDIQWL